MSAPELDRLATEGFYGDANSRFVSIITRGWYDIHEQGGLLIIITSLKEQYTIGTDQE